MGRASLSLIRDEFVAHVKQDKLIKIFRSYDVRRGTLIGKSNKLAKFRKCFIGNKVPMGYWLKPVKKLPYDDPTDLDKQTVNAMLVSYAHQYVKTPKTTNAFTLDCIDRRTTTYLSHFGYPIENIVICERDDRVRRVHQCYVPKVVHAEFHEFAESRRLKKKYTTAFIDCNNKITPEYVNDVLTFIERFTHPTGCIYGITFYTCRVLTEKRCSLLKEFRKRVCNLPDHHVDILSEYQHETRPHLLTIYLRAKEIN